MKHLWLLLTLLCACSGPVDDIELGEAQEAMTAQCLGDGFGANLNTWDNTQCNSGVSGENCHLPGKTSVETNRVFPPMSSMSLDQGWSSSEKTDISPSGVAVEAWFSNLYPGLTESGFVPFDFGTSPQPGGSYVEISKGTISGTISHNFDFADWQDIVHLACTNSTALSEGYAAGFRKCTHWEATWDYSDFLSWVDSRGCNRAVARGNVLRKMQLFALGYGSHSTQLAQGVADNLVMCTVSQTVWYPSSEQNWIANYDTSNPTSLTCVSP